MAPCLAAASRSIVFPILAVSGKICRHTTGCAVLPLLAHLGCTNQTNVVEPWAELMLSIFQTRRSARVPIYSILRALLYVRHTDKNRPNKASWVTFFFFSGARSIHFAISTCRPVGSDREMPIQRIRGSVGTNGSPALECYLLSRYQVASDTLSLAYVF